MGDAVGRLTFGKLLGSSIKGFSSAAVSLMKSAESGAARVAKAASNFNSRGSQDRALPIDESDAGWRSRAGRSSGAETYESGDVCRSLFRRALALSPRDRENLYGGAVLLVGIVGAEGLPQTESAYYVGISVYDAAGHDLSAEHKLTHSVSGSTSPSWDEVYPIGLHLPDFDTAVSLRASVKSYAGPLMKSGRVGAAKFPMATFHETADALSGTWSVVDAPLLDNEGEKVPGASLRLMFLLHRTMPLPHPTSIGVCVVSALGLQGADGAPPDASAVALSLMSRVGARVSEGDSGTGSQTKALRTATVPSTNASPELNELFEFWDVTFGGVPPEVTAGAPGSWGWPGGLPQNFSSLPMHSISCDMAAATTLSISALDVGRLGDASLGDVGVIFSSVWGHEDAVVNENTIRICRWWGIRGGGAGAAKAATKSTARPPRLYIDIVFRFEQPLLPPGWVEAVCNVSGDAYFYCPASGVAQWEPPAWPAEAVPPSARLDRFESMRGRAVSSSFAVTGRGRTDSSSFPEIDVDGMAAAATVASTATTDVVPGDAPHKPPRPRNFLSPIAAGQAAGSAAEAAAPSVAPLPSSPILLPKPAKSNSAMAVTVAGPSGASKTHPGAAASAAAQRPPTDEKGDEDGKDDEDAAEEAAPEAAVDTEVGVIGGSAASRADKALSSVPTFSNPLSGSAGKGATVVDREGAFFAAMQKTAAAKREADEAALKAKLAAMTPEEKEEYEREKAAEAKREQRRERMLGSHLKGYGAGAVRGAASPGRGRGRGRGK